MELARLPPVPKCTSDAEPSVHCLQGTSYASAFGVGSAVPRSAVTHQWPYSTYLGDAKGLLSNSTPGVPGVAYNGNCSTLAGIQWKTEAEADVALASCPKTMVRTSVSSLFVVPLVPQLLLTFRFCELALQRHMR